MTRINLVPPKELSDQHLLAEYHELPRVIKQDISTTDAPVKYCLGKGHMKWAKLHSTFIMERYIDILHEMFYRGYKTNYTFTSLFEIYCKSTPLHCKIRNYHPDIVDLSTSRNRLVEKYKLKPHYYTWTKRCKPHYYGD